MQDKHLDKPERRRFLKGMAATSGALALATVTRGAHAGDAEAPADVASADQAVGYRLSTHIADYYRTLRI